MFFHMYIFTCLYFKNEKKLWLDQELYISRLTSERLKGSWSTYKLERSEMLKKSW